MDAGSLLTESGRPKSLIKTIEKKTARIPSSFFLALAGGAVALSLGLAVSKKKRWANFVGQWVPTILLLGIYDKMANTQTTENEEAKSSLLH